MKFILCTFFDMVEINLCKHSICMSSKIHLLRYHHWWWRMIISVNFWCDSIMGGCGGRVCTVWHGTENAVSRWEAACFILLPAHSARISLRYSVPLIEVCMHCNENDHGWFLLQWCRANWKILSEWSWLTLVTAIMFSCRSRYQISKNGCLI